jgi:hypothetical protein
VFARWKKVTKTAAVVVAVAVAVAGAVAVAVAVVVVVQAARYHNIYSSESIQSTPKTSI